MPARDEARAFLRLAREDFLALTHMLDEETFRQRIFGFQAQQSVEKALKAWILAHDRSHPHTHDLSLLLGILMDLGADSEQYLKLIDLTNYATHWRYELHLTDTDSLDRDLVLADVASMLDAIELAIEALLPDS